MIGLEAVVHLGGRCRSALVGRLNSAVVENGTPAKLGMTFFKGSIVI